MKGVIMDPAYALMDEAAWTKNCIKLNKDKRALLPIGHLNIYKDEEYTRWTHVFPDPDAASNKAKEKTKDIYKAQSNHITNKKKRIKTKRKYINKKEEPFAAALAEATILDALIEFDEAHLENLITFLENYHPEERGNLHYKYEDEYYRLAAKRNIEFFPDLQKELNDTYETSTYKLHDKKVQTNAGIKVRSKSEASIVNALLNYKMPFIYEPIIIVKNADGEYVQLAPDFIFIDPKTGKKWMWQHLGLMDNPAYAKRNLLNLITLYQAGWIPSQNLIITTGTKDRPFTPTDAEAHMRLYFPTTPH